MHSNTTETLFPNIYRLQRSCEGYAFTRVCDSVHRGGYSSIHCRWYPSMPCSRGRVPTRGGVCDRGSLLWGVPAPGDLLPGVPALEGGYPLGGTCSGGCLLQGVPALGGACSGGTETLLKADGYCCRWYASYWNAFLNIRATLKYTGKIPTSLGCH